MRRPLPNGLTKAMLAGILAFCCIFTLSAQDVIHPVGGTNPVSVMAGTTINYYDSGGADCDNGLTAPGEYAANSNATVEFCPDAPGSIITIEFLEVDVETRTTAPCWDFLTIFDGDLTSTDQLFTGCGEEGFESCPGGFTGDQGDGGGVEGGPNDINGSNSTITTPTNNIFTSTAANGCLTVNFTSDSSVNEGGWVATVSASAPDEEPFFAGCVAATWDDNSIHLLDEFYTSVSSFPAGATFPNGVSTDGTLIYSAHFVNSTVYAYDLAGNIQYSWTNPAVSGVMGSTVVGSNLAVGSSSQIAFLDLLTGVEDYSFPIPYGGLEGLTYDGTVIWVLHNGGISSIDPITGAELSTIANAAAAASCSFNGTGIAVVGDDLLLSCTDGSLFLVSTADGSVIETSNNGLNMYGLGCGVQQAPPSSFGLVCSDTTIYLDAMGNFTIDPTFVTAGSTFPDDGSVDVTLSNSVFNCDSVGTRFVTVTATGTGEGSMFAGFQGPFDPSTFSFSTVGITQPDFQSADFGFTPTTLTLETSSEGADCGNEFYGEITHTFTEAGVLTFDFTHTTDDPIPGLDGFILRTDGTMDPIDIVMEGAPTPTTGTANGVVEVGDMIMIRLIEDDGCASLNNELLIENWLLQSEGAQVTETCIATVTVLDTIPPTALCQDVTIFLDANGNASLTGGGDVPFTGAVAALDATDDVWARPLGNGVTCSTTTGVDHFYDAYSFTVDAADMYTFTIEDGAGIDSYIFLYAGGFDATAPCDNFVEGDDDGAGTGLESEIVIQLDLVPGDYTLVVSTFSANDDGAYELTVSSANGGNALMPNPNPGTPIVDNGSFDNCGEVTFAVSQADFTCADVGDNTVTLTVTDASGNMDECTATVTVLDEIDPTAVCQDVTIVLNDNGTAVLPGGGTNGVVVGPVAGSLPIQLDATSALDVTCNCPTGSVAVGYEGRAGCIMDNFRLICKEVLADGTLGAATTVTCFNGNQDMVIESYTTTGNNVLVGFDVQDANFDFNSFRTLVSIEGQSKSIAAVLNGDDNTMGNSTVTALAGEGCFTDSPNMNAEYAPAGNVIVGMEVNQTNVYVSNVSFNYAPLTELVAGAPAIDGGSFDNCGEVTFGVSQSNFSCADIGDNDVVLTVNDANGNTSSCTAVVTVDFNEPDLGCISEINVTLNEFCQTALIPEMVLAGNTVCLDQFLFDIVVMDEDPSNGPVIDGCGRFQYTIESSTLAPPPPPVNGFVGAFAQSNWNELIINPNSGGDAATIDFTATTLTLNTSSDFSCGTELSAEATYMFSTSGTVSFNFDHQSSEGIGFDLFMVRLDGTMVDITANGTNGTVSELVEPGDMLMLKVLEVDGCFSTFNTLTITDFVFTEPGLEGMVLENFLGCWGFVNAEDKTSPRITDSIVAPEELFCVDLATISLNALPANVSRCFQVDSDGNPPVNFYNTALGQRLARGSATGQIPGFFDGCSSMEICVNDLIPAVDPCDDVVITRVYTATDGDCPSVSGESNAPTVFTYQIIFTRPDVDSVQSSATLAEFSCSDVLTLLPINQFGNQNPVPAVEDYPFVVRADGTPIYLDETFCNLGATFEDGPRIVTCANTYKFVRTWTVIDWCEVSNIRTFTQLVKVGDFEAPVITPPTQDLNFDGIADAYPLFYSTNTSDCRSIFIIPAGSATDACDNAPTVSAVIYPFGDTLALGFGPYAVGSPTFDGIPRGTHTIRYTATDDCGNESILDVPVTIGDATAPVAICEDGLNISIGGPIGPQGGSAQLCADDIDAASYDDCSDVQLRITRVDAENRPIDANGNLVIPAQNAYVNCITLTCADLGNVRVSLRVTDDGNDDGLFQFGIDNSNFCWLDVLVEDKTAPICIAPAPQTINCNDLSGEFPDDLNLAVVTDPEGTFALLNDQFGAATGLDNCPDPVVTQSVVDNRNSCGVGTIVRTFTVTDGEGFTSPPNCGQVITVQAVHDYTVVFPGDQESDQCIEPDYNAVTYTEFGCDLLTISTSIDTFSATADECYKLRITYEVLNWCEYNTLDAAYMIPRDADNDGILNNDTTVLHVVPRNAGLGDDLAYLDRDVNRANFNSIGNLDTGDGGILPGSEAAGYGNDGSRGAFLYQQFIKVYDDTPPTLVVTEPDSAFCSFAADCTGDVELNYEIDDECSPESVDATVELDAFVNPGADGVYTLADFVADGGNVTSLVTNNGDGTYTVNLDNLPIGEHAIRIRVTDGCGNVAVDLIEFEVVDCKAPTPICINGLTVTLMPDGTGGGMAAIWVSDFIASPSTDCSGPVEFAIYLDGEQPAVPSGLDTGLVLDCSLVGPQTIRIYAIDQAGNADYCLTTLMVQVFNSDVCNGPGSDGSLAGVVISTMDEMMDAVEVNISGQSGMTDTELTTTGLYQFTGLALGDDYTVEPTHDPSINLARVSTGDIILISRHILGLQEMTGTYQLKAGDVTQDDNLNILDIIAIRRVILGLDLSFSATNSWRFYVAGDDQFAETYTENNLAGAVSAPDFIAVEMGNVTDAANAFTGGAEDGGRSLKTIEIEEQTLEAGNTYAVTLRAGDLAGFQGTLQLGSGLELTNVNYAALQAGNVNLSKVSEGLIAFSYESKEAAGTELLTLEVRATVNAQLSELLSLTDRITRSEAYTTNDELARLGLNFGTTAIAGEVKFALEQNSPNPFVDQTQVRFTLPSAATVQLTIQNQQGQLLRTLEIDAAAGANQITVGREQLNGATGVLTYTLVAGEFVATRKMIVQ